MAEQNSIGRRGIICISVIGVCIVIVIGLQAATLHRLNFEFNDTEGSQPRCSAIVQLSLQDELRHRFPGMFEADAEIMKRVRFWINSTENAANTTADAVTKECVADYCKINMIEVTTCCCNIKTSFLSPTTAIDTEGNNRTLAQFNDNKQYFFTEDCTHTSSGNCLCVALRLISTAVYVIDEALNQYGVAFFTIGRVCHSLSV